MDISYDPRKNERNVRERGISFERATEFDFETAIYTPDRRKDYGELRIRAIGYLGARLHVLVYTMRGEWLHVISLRKANTRERKKYEASIQTR